MRVRACVAHRDMQAHAMHHQSRLHAPKAIKLFNAHDIFQAVHTHRYIKDVLKNDPGEQNDHSFQHLQQHQQLVEDFLCFGLGYAAPRVPFVFQCSRLSGGSLQPSST